MTTLKKVTTARDSANHIVIITKSPLVKMLFCGGNKC